MYENKLLRRVFKNRNLDDASIQQLFTPYYDELQNTAVFIDTVSRWAQYQTHITIITDYDMDGIMSGVCALTGLSEIGCCVELFKPSIDGYSLTLADMDRLMIEHPNTQAVITSDIGVNEKEALSYLKTKYACEIVVTDHHEEDARQSSRDVADVFIDPCASGESVQLREICGAAVIYKLLMAYAHTYCKNNVGNNGYDLVDKLSRLVVFAGIATVSDMMPVAHDNRGYIKDAISMLRVVWSGGNDYFVRNMTGFSEQYSSAFRGLYMVCESFYNAGKLSTSDDIDENFFGFYLAPTFNSVRRMGGDIECAFKIFSEDATYADVEYLISLNEKRKTQTAMWFEDMKQSSNAYAPYIYITAAPAGLRGLLATKAMGESGLPTLVVGSNGKNGFSGSGRSPVWYPFITKMGDYAYARGHEGAFGVGFTNMKEIERFSTRLRSDVEEVLDYVCAFDLEPEWDYVIATNGSGDIGIENDVFFEFYELLQLFRPFGVGFKEPVGLLKFNMEQDQVAVQVMGKQHQHLKLHLPFGFDVVCWNQADIATLLTGDIECVGKLSVNEWNDQKSMQFIGSIRM